MRITHVAIIRNGKTYALPKPNRHHNVLFIMPRKSDDSRDQQGFLLESGAYVGRAEAYKIAVASGQINRRMFPGCYNGTDLYSEDLW